MTCLRCSSIRFDRLQWDSHGLVPSHPIPSQLLYLCLYGRTEGAEWFSRTCIQYTFGYPIERRTSKGALLLPSEHPNLKEKKRTRLQWQHVLRLRFALSGKTNRPCHNGQSGTSSMFLRAVHENTVYQNTATEMWVLYEQRKANKPRNYICEEGK